MTKKPAINEPAKQSREFGPIHLEPGAVASVTIAAGQPAEMATDAFRYVPGSSLNIMSSEDPNRAPLLRSIALYYKWKSRQRKDLSPCEQTSPVFYAISSATASDVRQNQIIVRLPSVQCDHPIRLRLIAGWANHERDVTLHLILNVPDAHGRCGDRSPRVGDPVHFHPDDSGPRAAIVTAVELPHLGSMFVNLGFLTTDGRPDSELAVPFFTEPRPGHWTWPPAR